MDIRALRYFSEVAKQGNFTRAAEVLHVTQPAISKMIRQLEDQLETPLLIRGPNSARMTEAGCILDRHAKEILKQFGELNTAIASLKGLVTGELRFALPPLIAGEKYFTRELGQFHCRYPGITLRIQEVNGLAVEDGIEAGDWDIGVTAWTDRDLRFDRMTLFRGYLSAVVPASNRWSGTQITMAALADEKFVLFSEGMASHITFRNACKAAGFMPNVVCTSGQRDFLLGLVDAGMGVSVFPSNLIGNIDPAQFITLRITPDLDYHLALIWRADRHPSFAAKAFIELVQESLVAGQLQVGVA